MGKKYGGVISLAVLGTQYVVFNSAKAANDILEKKSAITSDRPHFTLAHELVGWDDIMIFWQYGEKYRQYRKFFHKQIGTKNSLAEFYSAEELETKRFLRNVLSSPDDLVAHSRRMAGSVILKISHGYDVKGEDNSFLEMTDKAKVCREATIGCSSWINP